LTKKLLESEAELEKMTKKLESKEEELIVQMKKEDFFKRVLFIIYTK